MCDTLSTILKHIFQITLSSEITHSKNFVIKFDKFELIISLKGVHQEERIGISFKHMNKQMLP